MGLQYAMQGITSGDMELLSVLPGTIYDHASMRLEDGYGSNSEKDEPVLCTVGLGLRKVVAKKNEKRVLELCTQIMKPATIVFSWMSGMRNISASVMFKLLVPSSRRVEVIQLVNCESQALSS